MSADRWRLDTFGCIYLKGAACSETLSLAPPLPEPALFVPDAAPAPGKGNPLAAGSWKTRSFWKVYISSELVLGSLGDEAGCGVLGVLY